MKCLKCHSKMNGNGCNDINDEIICEVCGAAYCLEYLGYYLEGSDNRIDDGFEEEEYLKFCREMREKKVI